MQSFNAYWDCAPMLLACPYQALTKALEPNQLVSSCELTASSTRFMLPNMWPLFQFMMILHTVHWTGFYSYASITIKQCIWSKLFTNAVSVNQPFSIPLCERKPIQARGEHAISTQNGTIDWPGDRAQTLYHLSSIALLKVIYLVKQWMECVETERLKGSHSVESNARPSDHGLNALPTELLSSLVSMHCVVFFFLLCI